MTAAESFTPQASRCSCAYVLHRSCLLMFSALILNSQLPCSQTDIQDQIQLGFDEGGPCPGSHCLQAGLGSFIPMSILLNPKLSHVLSDADALQPHDQYQGTLMGQRIHQQWPSAAGQASWPSAYRSMRQQGLPVTPSLDPLTHILLSLLNIFRGGGLRRPGLAIGGCRHTIARG